MSRLVKFVAVGFFVSASVCSATEINKYEEEKEKSPFHKPIQLNGFNHENDFLELLDQQNVTVGQKKYMLIIDDTVRNAVIDGAISREKLEETFEKITKDKPNDKVMGYSVGLCGKRISIERFLGDNAK